MFAKKSLAPLLLHQKRYFQYLDIHPSVKRCLLEKKPIVALESTIITHGMPYPQNLETALEVERQVRSNGAEPATIAILDGRLKVGLNGDDLQSLASRKRSEVIKCSRRDMPFAVSGKLTAGTTVAATMIISHMVGISIFATGGVGGVHRDGHISMDVSADLVEMGRTPVAVVCSGVKSILDIPRTLEYLETQGVCVASFGENVKSFPDFYTRDSGCHVPYNLQNANSAAKLIKALKTLELSSGILIGVPVPEAFAADKQEITAAIDAAYAEANRQGVAGKEVTPFMLSAIAKITKGNSLAANMALIKNNAAVAAQIAYELSEIGTGTHIPLMNGGTLDISKKTDTERTVKHLTPFVVGASILDLSLTMYDDIPTPLDGATYHTQAKQSAGGVARNIAECLYKLHGSAKFVSIVGNDELGRSLLHMIPSTLQSGVHVCNDRATSLCSLLFDRRGDCKLILGNMEIHEKITPELIRKHEEDIVASPLIVIDANLHVNTIECILQMAAQHKIPVFFEPTDMRIAGKPFSLPRSLTEQIKIISPNFQELRTIVQAFSGKTPAQCLEGSLENRLDLTKDLLTHIQKEFDCILVTLGEHGSVLSCRVPTNSDTATPMFDAEGNYCVADSSSDKYFMKYYAAPQVTHIKNVSGAGDSYSSGFITGLLRGYDMERAVALGSLAAVRSLMSESAVPQAYFSDANEETQLLENTLIGLQKMAI